MPLRARRRSPQERPPSGKTQIASPARSASTAFSSAPGVAAPRLIGIWPIP